MKPKALLFASTVLAALTALPVLAQPPRTSVIALQVNVESGGQKVRYGIRPNTETVPLVAGQRIGAGHARIIKDVKEMSRVRAGDVLVAEAAPPLAKMDSVSGIVEHYMDEKNGSAPPSANRITLLRLTSMTQPGRLKRSKAEIREILAAIEAGDGDRAEAACKHHIEMAAEVALAYLARAKTAA